MKKLEASPPAIGAQNSLDLFTSLQSDQTGFERLAALLKKTCGIHLIANSKNFSLMAGRLVGLMRENGFESYHQYERHLSKDPRALDAFVFALTTNTTQFFREKEHFAILTRALPELLELKSHHPSRELRVWCAAASTGQEPYCLAMTLLEAIQDPVSSPVRMLATDIDTEVLARASQGVYLESEMADVSDERRKKFFRKGTRKGHPAYQASRQLREMIRFARLNLVEPFPFAQKFDVIFCRNVLIYFDEETKHSAVEKMIDCLHDGGLLFVGHSESGAVRSDKMTSVASAVYQKQSAPGARKAYGKNKSR